MGMTYFLLGLIIGILMRDLKCKTILSVDKYKKSQENKGSAQFFESLSTKEKFSNAESLDDLLE